MNLTLKATEKMRAPPLSKKFLTDILNNRAAALLEMKPSANLIKFDLKFSLMISFTSFLIFISHSWRICRDDGTIEKKIFFSLFSLDHLNRKCCNIAIGYKFTTTNPLVAR